MNGYTFVQRTEVSPMQNFVFVGYDEYFGLSINVFVVEYC